MTRASDAAREAAIERLKDAYVRGALPTEEFRDRIARALAAPTEEHLGRLTSDVAVDTLAFHRCSRLRSAIRRGTDGNDSGSRLSPWAL
jgi:Domain of unknown function (DUF1707)